MFAVCCVLSVGWCLLCVVCLRFAGCSMMFVKACLFFCCILHVVRDVVWCLLIAVFCLRIGLNCSLMLARGVLLVGCCPLYVIVCSLIDARSLLDVVCCLLLSTD